MHIFDNLFDELQPYQHLINTFTWSKKKKLLYLVNLIILCTSQEISIYWKFKDKILNLF